MPVPRLATRQMGYAGGRKTSACTSFQPLSSWVGCSSGLAEARAEGEGEGEGMPPSGKPGGSATVHVRPARAVRGRQG